MKDEQNVTGEELARRIIEESKNEPVEVVQSREFPPWFDANKFKKGQIYFQNNYFALFVSKLSGLLVILAVPSILRVLIMTGKSSEPITAFKRYLDTILHMLKWYKGDISDLKSSLHKSLMEVRSKHCAASKSAVSSKYGHISQQDMVLTQFGFMGFALIRAEFLGIKGSDEEIEGFLHFWRTIGWLIGIKEKYNLCSLSENIAESKQCCQILCDKVFKVLMTTPNVDFHPMAIALLEGVKPLVPTMEPEAFLLFTKELCSIEINIDKLNFSERFMYKAQVFVHRTILNSAILSFIFKPILNFIMWFAIYLCETYTFLFTVLHFGRK